MIKCYKFSVDQSQSEVQYCAKVMRANFDEFRLLFSRIFEDMSAKSRAVFRVAQCDISKKMRRNYANSFEVMNFPCFRNFEEMNFRFFEFSKRRTVIKNTPYIVNCGNIHNSELNALCLFIYTTTE